VKFFYALEATIIYLIAKYIQSFTIIIDEAGRKGYLFSQGTELNLFGL